MIGSWSSVRPPACVRAMQQNTRVQSRADTTGDWKSASPASAHSPEVDWALSPPSRSLLGLPNVPGWWGSRHRAVIVASALSRLAPKKRALWGPCKSPSLSRVNSITLIRTSESGGFFSSFFSFFLAGGLAKTTIARHAIPRPSLLNALIYTNQ